MYVKSKANIAVRVAVSQASQNLRQAQAALNGFVWSTEIAYDIALSRKLFDIPGRHKSVYDLLSDLPTAPWYRNNQGRIHYERTASQFLGDIRRNRRYVHRAGMVYIFSAFEEYLEQRVRTYIGWGDYKWGPYLKSLSHGTELTKKTQFPLKLQTVLQADLLREIRNRIVHSSSLPRTIDDAAGEDLRRKARNWPVRNILNLRRQDDWRDREPNLWIEKAMKAVIGRATTAGQKTRNPSALTSVEMFWLLYALSTLDRLVFEIEEAMPDGLADRTGRINWRRKNEVRRKELIVGV